MLKRGEGNKGEDYREITLTLYKMYTEVLARKLREEIEGKGLIPANQTGFKKEKGTIDNIYVLYYLVNRNINIKGGELIAFFLDLRWHLTQ